MAEADFGIGLAVDGIARFEQDMGRATRAVGGATSQMGKMFTQLGGVMAATFGAAAIKQFVFDSVDRFATFEQGLADLSAITGATGKDLEFFKDQAVKMGRGIEGGAAATVEAFKLIGSAKPELLSIPADLAKVTDAAITLSHAAGMQLPEAATALTDALNQFKAPAEEAARYINVLGAGAKFGSAEIPETTAALLQFGTAAAAINVPIESATAAIQTLAAQGRKGAEAGTDLRAVFGKIASIDALPKEAIEQLNKFGVNLAKVKNTTIPVSERLQELSKVAGDQTALMRIFGEEHKIAAGILLNSLPTFTSLEKSLTGTNTATEQAAIRTATLKQRFLELQNRLNEVMLAVGEGLMPVFDDFFKGFEDAFITIKQLFTDVLAPFGDLLSAFSELGKSLGIVTGTGSKFAGIVSLLATTTRIATAPLRLFLGFWTKAIEVFTWARDGLKSITEKIPLLGGAIKILLGPIGVLNEALGFLGGLFGSSGKAAEEAAARYKHLQNTVAQTVVQMGGGKGDVTAFIKTLDQAQFAGLNQAEALQLLQFKFRLYLDETKKAAKATDDFKKAANDAGMAVVSGPLPGSIDFINAQLDRLKKAFTATDSELKRLSIGKAIEGYEFQLAKFTNTVDKLRSADILEALGVRKEDKDSIEATRTEAEKLHQAINDVTQLNIPQRSITDLLPKPEEFETQRNLWENFANTVSATFKELGQSVKETFLSIAGDTAFALGEVIAMGGNVGDVLKKAFVDLLIQLPKMAGMALLNAAAFPGNAPIALPLAAVGLGLLGASGIISGIAKASDKKKQDRFSAPDAATTSAVAGASQGQLGLTSFLNADEIGNSVANALNGRSMVLNVDGRDMDGYLDLSDRKRNMRRGH